MVKYLTLSMALVAMIAIKSAVATFPFLGMDGLGAIPATASNIEAAKAQGHALAAENRATDAAVDRATGNPIGAAINENRALGQTAAAHMAASRSTTDAVLANGMGGSAVSAIGANIAANSASRSVGGAMGLGYPGYSGIGSYGALGGYPGYGAYPGYGLNAYPGYPYLNYGYSPMGYGAGMRQPLAAAAAGASASSGAALANNLANSAAAVGPILGVSY